MPKNKGEQVFTPEFLAAMRRVLGDDSGPTFARATYAQIQEIQALAARDPRRWFVSALDEHGIPRLYAHGDTEEEAMKKAQLAVTQYRASKQSFRQMEPRTEWTFHPYPPDED